MEELKVARFLQFYQTDMLSRALAKTCFFLLLATAQSVPLFARADGFTNLYLGLCLNRSHIMQLLFDENGRLRPEWIVMTSRELSELGSPTPVRDQVLTMGLASADGEGSIIDRIHVDEFNASLSASHYEIALHGEVDTNRIIARAAGGEMGEGMYGGRAALPGGVSLHGHIVTIPGSFLLAEGFRYEVVQFAFGSGSRIVGLVEENLRVGETPHGIGYTVGAAAGAALEIPSSDRRPPLRFHLTGGPAVGNVSSPLGLPVDTTFNSGFEYTW